MTGCTGCRHDDHCGKQLDVSRSVGCVEYDAGTTGCAESCSHPDCRAVQPPHPLENRLREVEALIDAAVKRAVAADEAKIWGGGPHPLLALEQRLREDAERAGHEAWRHGRGSYECGLRRGEALGLTRAADEIAAIARGERG